MNEEKLLNQLDELILGNSSYDLKNELNIFTDLINDLMYDSLSIIQLVVQIEDEFGVEIPDEDLDISKLRQYKWLKDFIMGEKLKDDRS